MEESTEGDGVWGFPKVEDSENVDKVFEESTVFVPTF